VRAMEAKSALRNIGRRHEAEVSREHVAYDVAATGV
jgi:hypothetical protein